MPPIKLKAIEWLGWCGALATIAAYALVSFRVLSPTALSYQALNLFAALALGTETFVHKDYQPFAVNLVWGGITLIALLSVVRLHI